MITINFRTIACQLLLPATIAFSTSCSEPKKVVEYINGKQLLNMNERTAYGEPMKPIELLILKPDSIIVGEQAVFKVVTSNPSYKLVNGLFDCDITEMSVIDTTKFKVDSCVKGYIVQNDTLYIAFKSPQIGKKKFDESIIGISRDGNGVFRYHMGIFDYEVTE